MQENISKKLNLGLTFPTPSGGVTSPSLKGSMLPTILLPLFLSPSTFLPLVLFDIDNKIGSPTFRLPTVRLLTTRLQQFVSTTIRLHYYSSPLLFVSTTIRLHPIRLHYFSSPDNSSPYDSSPTIRLHYYSSPLLFVSTTIRLHYFSSPTIRLHYYSSPLLFGSITILLYIV